jgi:hypothetical protein
VLRALISAGTALALAGCGASAPRDESSGLRFLPAAGWNTASAVGPGCPTGGAAASTGVLDDVPSDFPGETIKRLPPTATLVWACSVPAGDASEFAPATLPLQLSDARIDESWETQPNPNVPQYLLWRRVDSYDLDVRVFFGNQQPSAQQLAEAQAELARLRLPA